MTLLQLAERNFIETRDIVATVPYGDNLTQLEILFRSGQKAVILEAENVRKLLAFLQSQSINLHSPLINSKVKIIKHDDNAVVGNIGKIVSAHTDNGQIMLVIMISNVGFCSVYSIPVQDVEAIEIAME